MSEKKITVIEEPMAYIGLPKGSDLVAQIFNPETEHEVRVLLGPLQAIAIAQQLNVYAERLLAGHAGIIERERETDAILLERERPLKLDG